MKRLLRLLPVLLATAAFGDPVPSVTVGGRTFPFTFEDGTLAENERVRIASDVAALWEDQPGSVVQSGGEGRERLFNDSVWASPYQNGMDVPERIVDVGTNRCLLVSKAVSDTYREAFAFAAARTNEIAALAGFVAALQPSALSNATPAQVSSLLFGESNFDAAAASRIVADLSEVQFGRPSLLGFRIATGGELHVSPGALLLALPCHIRSSGRWEIWPATWLDGHWQLLPPSAD